MLMAERDSLPSMKYLWELEKSEDCICVACKKEISQYDRTWLWKRSKATMTGPYHSKCKEVMNA